MKSILENKRVVQVLPSGCMIWTGPTRNSGYGAITVNQKPKMAHRVSYEQAYGPIPDGLWVCHRCDVKTCINPDHLFLGTPKENAIDAMNKGRVAKGELNGNSRLTKDQVLQIKELIEAGVKRIRIGAMFGVSGVAIGLIESGRTWRHVTNYKRKDAA